MGVVDGEKEERLERMKRRALEWKVRNECRAIIEDLIGDATLESEWRQQACWDLVLESADDAILESRNRLCKEVLVETVLTGAWEALEVRRIVKEAKDGGLMEEVEADLRMIREERECILMLVKEEQAQTRRLEKVDRLKRAWQLKMNAKKYQRMIILMEGMKLEDIEMEMEWIERCGPGHARGEGQGHRGHHGGHRDRNGLCVCCQI